MASIVSMGGYTVQFTDSNYRDGGIYEESNRVYIKSGENIKINPIDSKEKFTMIFFEYSEPVSVDNVFKVEFGNLVLADERIVPFEAQFYPVVHEFQQSH
jgi:hypothetical protein